MSWNLDVLLKRYKAKYTRGNGGKRWLIRVNRLWTSYKLHKKFNQNLSTCVLWAKNLFMLSTKTVYVFDIILKSKTIHGSTHRNKKSYALVRNNNFRHKVKKELSIKLRQKNLFWKHPMKQNNHDYIVMELVQLTSKIYCIRASL